MAAERWKLMSMRVGFIGLGRMGMPMARNILRAGFPLSVFNRSRVPVDELASIGAHACDSPREVALRSEILITCLPGPAEVEKVTAEALEEASAGSIFIDHSTVDPETSRKVAARAESRGVDFLDAPVSGGVSGAREGALTIMVGGDRQALERSRPVLEAVGRRIFHAGPVGCGSLAKLVNQAITTVAYSAIAEALVLGAKGGISTALLLEILSVSSARSRVLEQAGPAIIERRFEADFTLELAMKDLRLAIEAARALGVHLGTAEGARQSYEKALAQGLGNLDHAAVVIPVEREAGVTALGKAGG
jgi:3-hydroxyisobutyrate dehydrogenase-like beta-hydroxyacid dehydrogenase